MTKADADQQIKEASRLLKQGGLVAYPTETYYALGVDPFNTKALERLFAVKRRRPSKPVLILVEELTQIVQFAESIPNSFDTLMAIFWPGPLTLVFPARLHLQQLLTGGTGTVGIRQSPDPTASSLLLEFNGPITGTSANRSGSPAATTAEEVREIFGAEVDLILDGGPTPGGQGSTLVGYDQKIFCIRDGKIPFESIQNSLQENLN